ncbi:hypothetical protein F5X68DRAFT_214302 [Plectosphaerella plurivora]|uniref:Ams2/SPT21 N-terminal domain-containing protein n=1 Tax=Plectosphaerella plurivora TaxID=936078 RepID=A0A9P8V590_9PEZI|nr:hypothetical protein F5X68DRAFT_214302 [Plectosphaerella plurivora]
MASPMPVGNWAGQSQNQQHHNQNQQSHQGNHIRQEPPMSSQPQVDGAPEIRYMGLKISYTVDREAQVNYLARYPQTFQAQVIPLDERSSIGIADLKVCAQCIVDCSPEILSQSSDYTVYAYDFSESDHPLVGQGMLSWILNSDASQAKMVVGRVTNNVLAAFSGGLKETLEVKLKLTPSTRIVRQDARPALQRAESQFSMDMPMSSQHGQQSQDCVVTPSGASEWNSFVQTNLQPAPAASTTHRTASPAPAPPQSRAGFAHSRHSSFSMPPQQQLLPQPQQSHMQMSEPIQQQPTQQQSEGPSRVAPVLVEGPVDGVNPPSRPSSRASTRSRKKAPTGRPRGRPKKKQPSVETQGSTSGYEEGTDGEEGPAKKKRITTIQAAKNINTPFGGGPELLRVAASTSGSIRAMRPAGQTPDPTQGNHLQEIPRAPTPVPESGPRHGSGGAKQGGLRRQSTLSQATLMHEQPSQPMYVDMSFEMSPPSQDGRSPGESEAATPLYSEGTPAPIGSSPPVPRAASFIRSSPPASSPILPPMRKSQPDSGFMSGGVEDTLEEPKPLELPPSKAPIASKKRGRNGGHKIPVKVFNMQLEAIPSLTKHDEPFLHIQAPQRFQPIREAPAKSPPPPPPSDMAQMADMGGMGDMADMVDLIEMPDATTAAVGEDQKPQVAAVVGTAETGKDPSPQPKEQAVASNANAGVGSVTAPTAQNNTPHFQHLEKDLEDELLAALQVVTNAEGELPGVASGRHSPSTVFDYPPLPTAHSMGGRTAHQLMLPMIPASDPIGPLALPTLPLPSVTSFSEAPCPPSEALEPPKSPKASKNFVKKESIRQKLQQAIQSGEMPPYCHNCGAIETPTWRKIWVQDHEGIPEVYEYSEKPGRVTAVIVLERDEEEVPTKYQLIKKSLDSDDDKPSWQQLLLCNPCGIWICKWKKHRPEERWEKDQTRLQNGGRRIRKPVGPRPPRPSKPRRKTQRMEPTSELNFETDPIGPEDYQGPGRLTDIDEVKGEARSREASFALEQALRSDFLPPSREHRFRPGSTHSRGSGTVCSPIALDEEEEATKMGTTRRLLFPSPRKDGVAKTLDAVSINMVKSPMPQLRKTPSDAKENLSSQSSHGIALDDEDDELEALFRSPLARPSTPPPNDKSASHGPFKTPTRPASSHRPITRSISRSIRSVRSQRSAEKMAGLLQRTPTRTPRSIARLLVSESPSVRRSPRLAHPDTLLETPMTRSLNLLLSDANNDYDIDPSTLDLDLSIIGDLGNNAHEMIDFGNLLSTDAIMPSSPPKRIGGVFDYGGTSSMWADWSDAGHLDVDMET